MDQSVDLSIIIVNYNVKDYLSQCLNSIFASITNFTIEVIVVDNNSTDGSVEFIKNNYPSVILLASSKNLGFGVANNKAFEIAKGRYLLLLNPDTVLQEDTLQAMYDFMEQKKDVGISGCKVLNPNGTLQLACRRGIPTPWVAFTKLFGLQSLFPKSKLFGQYNLTYLPPDDFAYVDAISGSFMFVRREVYEQLGGFDPNFFMYGEDLDFCLRAKQNNWKIAYFPKTSIIHYKGQSTKRGYFDNTYHFFKSMEIFTRKHFGKSKLFLAFIKIGILLRQLLEKISKYKSEIVFVVLDLLFANLSLFVASWIRFGNMFSFPDYAYPTVFIVLSLVVFLSMVSTGEYFEFRHSIWTTSFALLISFFVLSSLTYFFKEFAFSRGVLLLTIGLTLVFTNLSRIILNLKKQIDTPRRIAFFGYNRNTEAIIESLEKTNSTNIELVGIFLLDENVEIPTRISILGNIDKFLEAIELKRINEIIVTDERISRIQMLELLQKAEGKKIKIYYAQGYEDMVASEFIASLTKEENLLDFYKLSKFRYRFYKRVFDLVLLVFLLTIGIPFLFLFFDKSKRKMKYLLNILTGKMTFVGLDKEFRQIYSKEPIVTISDANRGIIFSKRMKEKLNNFYLQNYSPLLDLEILFKYKRDNHGKSTTQISS
ncbi:MAG: glycosyltransferase [Candidatus Kapaibacteriota bacterium]